MLHVHFDFFVFKLCKTAHIVTLFYLFGYLHPEM